jgi:Xaa-Pro dipeptidase
MERRDFITGSTIGLGAASLLGLNSCSSNTLNSQKEELESIRPMTNDVVPISLEERNARIAKAQKLMSVNHIDALVLDAGTSLNYFTGISWWPSERPMLTVIPAQGDVIYICPGFEEDRLREIIILGNKIYAWQEDESPYNQVALAIKDAGITSGTIGIEERMRFFIFDGIKKAAPQLNYVSGDPITIPCRIIKSPAEIALMQKATDITVEAIKIGLLHLKEGCTPSDFSDTVASVHQKLGANHDFAMANFGEASAFPHGSIKPQRLKNGDIVLVDCGCTVEGYNSDISRTIVFNAVPTKRQIEIWDLEKKAQAAGFEAAKIGSALHEVDAASRSVLTDAGFGPGYKLPGLPHRTGHGIGMDGHEWGNAVMGNEQLIKPGMCFSIEPNISIIGEFGIRLEDCVFITDEGPQWFSKPSPSIEVPFA